MSTDMLEDICVCNSCMSIKRIDACCKKHDCIKQGQAEWKGASSSTWNMGKNIYKILKDIVNKLLQALPSLGESRSEGSYFNP